MKREKKAKTEIHVYLPPPTFAKLLKLAAIERRSVTQQVVVLVEERLRERLVEPPQVSK